jgi:DNA mismatch repair ATPase MutS
MDSGKLKEELLRMNDIIDRITTSSMVLFNEPFASTAERDGSKIADDVITALYESDIKVMFVTHLYEFANLVFEKQLEKAFFLRAERDQNGSRSFCIKPGRPLITSYGDDLYNKIIGV